MLSFQPCGVVIANMDKLYPCEVSLKLKGQAFLFFLTLRGSSCLPSARWQISVFFHSEYSMHWHRNLYMFMPNGDKEKSRFPNPTLKRLLPGHCMAGKNRFLPPHKSFWTTFYFSSNEIIQYK